MFEIITGDGEVYGPLTLRELLDRARSMPTWVCWEARTIWPHAASKPRLKGRRRET